MTDREKVIEWVVEVYPNAIWSPAQLDALQRFATIAQAEAFEQAAAVCDYRNTIPAAPFAMIKECATAIRALKEK